MGSPEEPELETRFLNLPPFPKNVPAAPLTRISLSSLLEPPPSLLRYETSHRLLEACKNLGFFYLDLRNTAQGDAVLDNAESLFGVQNALFKLPEEEKQGYDFMAKGMETYFGYKGIGTSFADSSRGIRDRNEFWNISQDDILNTSPPYPAPEILSSTRPLQEKFIRNAHTIATCLLSHLDTHLNLPQNTLPSLHRISIASDCQIRLLHAPPQPPDDLSTSLGTHTDFGSITILFNQLGGLQILPTYGKKWLYVQPLPGHAIVNLGDALGKFSNGVVKSNLHRVVSPPGEQARCDRFSLMYFLRPAEDVVLRSLAGVGGNGVIPPLAAGEGGEELSSREWIERTLRAKGRGGKVKEGEELYWEK